MGIYAVTERLTGTVVNRIEWDGVAPFHPGDAYELVPVQGPAGIQLSLPLPLFVASDELLPWPRFAPFATMSAGEVTNAQSWVRLFPIPATGESGSLVNVSIGAGGITFAELGAYHLFLRSTPIKVLVRDPDAALLDRVLTIAKFVSDSTCHAGADWPRMITGTNRFNVAWPWLKFFRSNMPLVFDCGGITVFIAFVLWTQGVHTRRVWLRKTVERTGHILVEATIPGVGAICLDGDFGVAILASAQQVLADRSNGFANIQLQAFGAKKDIPANFGLGLDTTGLYGWQPSHHDGASLMFGAAGYRAMLQTFCEGIELNEFAITGAGTVQILGSPIVIEG